MRRDIACIVEGRGEVQAVPILIRRVAQSIDPAHVVRVATPIRVSRDRIVKAGELERAVDLAALKAGRTGAVLILLDAERDCPARLGPELLRRAVQRRGDVPIAVVLAKQEYEAWFLAAATSLQGIRGLAARLEPPADAEAIRGAKEWLTHHMEGSRHYVEPVDQPALTACFDLAMAQQADSFQRCYRELVRLLNG